MINSRVQPARFSSYAESRVSAVRMSETSVINAAPVR